MSKLTRTITTALISVVLFSSTSTALASQYSGSMYAYLDKSVAATNNTKNFIDADEKGFISTDTSNSSDSSSKPSNSTSSKTQNSTSSGVNSKIDKESKYKFQCGLAAVVVKNKVGYINKVGKLVISAVYDDGTMFYEDAAFVKKGEKWALIDKTGKLLTGYIFDNIDDTDSLFKDIEINDYHGLLNSEGELVIPPIYPGVLNVDNENNISLSTYDSLKKILMENLIGSMSKDGKVSYNSSYTPFGSLTDNNVLSALNTYTTNRQFPLYNRVWSLGNGLYCGYKASSNNYLIFDKNGKQVYTNK